MNKDSEARQFKQLDFDDKDLNMFTITNLSLEGRKEKVHIYGDLLEEEDPDGDVNHLPSPPALADHHLRHHLLQTNLL